MAFVAVDILGNEFAFENKPKRKLDKFDDLGYFIKLPQGTIKKIIGRNLTWNDDPVEIK